MLLQYVGLKLSLLFIPKQLVQVGQFDREETPWDKLASETEVFSKEHQQVSLEGAQQSLVTIHIGGSLL